MRREPDPEPTTMRPDLRAAGLERQPWIQWDGDDNGQPMSADDRRALAHAQAMRERARQQQRRELGLT